MLTESGAISCEFVYMKVPGRSGLLVLVSTFTIGGLVLVLLLLGCMVWTIWVVIYKLRFGNDRSVIG